MSPSGDDRRTSARNERAGGARPVKPAQRPTGPGPRCRRAAIAAACAWAATVPATITGLITYWDGHERLAHAVWCAAYAVATGAVAVPGAPPCARLGRTPRRGGRRSSTGAGRRRAVPCRTRGSAPPGRGLALRVQPAAHRARSRIVVAVNVHGPRVRRVSTLEAVDRSVPRRPLRRCGSGALRAAARPMRMAGEDSPGRRFGTTAARTASRRRAGAGDGRRAPALEQLHDPGGRGRVVEHRSVSALHGEDRRAPRFEEGDLRLRRPPKSGASTTMAWATLGSAGSSPVRVTAGTRRSRCSACG